MKSATLAFFAICSLTIALPLFGTLGDGATFFVVSNAKALDILLFGFGIYLIPPAILITLFLIIRFVINQSVAHLFVSIMVGLLASLWAMGHASSAPTAGAIAVGIVAGALTTWAYLVYSDFRSFLQILGQVSPIVLIYFLAFTPVAQLILPSKAVSINEIGGNRTPVVVLIFDELSLAGLVTPDGKIDAGRLPHFSRLQHMSTWYQDATTASTATHRAIPAILSGKFPNEETLPTLSQFPQNLFTLLAGSHVIHAMETASKMCPKSVCNQSGKLTGNVFSPHAMYKDVGYVWLHTFFPPELATIYLPNISLGWGDFRESKTADTEQKADPDFEKQMRWMLKIGSKLKQLPLNDFFDEEIKEFSANIRLSSGSDLQYLHIVLPHNPWVRFPDGSVYNGDSTPGLTAANIWKDDKNLSDQGILQYALQVEYVDKLLGEVLDLLTESGRLNETLLIVLSDHGLAIAPGQSLRTPHISTLADTSRIPLFIKYPGQTKAILDQRKVQTIDILPTIADVLDIPLATAVDGQSLISDSWQPVKRRVLEAPEDIPDFEGAMDIRLAAERIYRVIEPGKSALNAFGTQNSRAFIGLPVPDITPTGPPLKLQVDNPEAYARINLETGVLPARLSGIVEGATTGNEILIALNGISAGSSMIYDDHGSVSILLDPRLFRDGFNELTAYTLIAGKLDQIEISTQDLPASPER